MEHRFQAEDWLMAYEYKYVFENMPEGWPFETRIDEVKHRAHIHPEREVPVDPETGLHYIMIDEETEKHHLDWVLDMERAKYGD
jgi:hypothetical protein